MAPTSRNSGIDENGLPTSSEARAPGYQRYFFDNSGSSSTDRRGGIASSAPFCMLACPAAVAIIRKIVSLSLDEYFEIANPSLPMRWPPPGGAVQLILPTKRDFFSSSIEAARVNHCSPIAASPCCRLMVDSSLAAEVNPRGANAVICFIRVMALTPAGWLKIGFQSLSNHPSAMALRYQCVSFRQPSTGFNVITVPETRP